MGVGGGHHPVTDLTCLLPHDRNQEEGVTCSSVFKGTPLQPGWSFTVSLLEMPPFQTLLFTHTHISTKLLKVCLVPPPRSDLRASAHTFQSVFLHIIFAIKQHPEQPSPALHTSVCVQTERCGSYLHFGANK